MSGPRPSVDGTSLHPWRSAGANHHLAGLAEEADPGPIPDASRLNSVVAPRSECLRRKSQPMPHTLGYNTGSLHASQVLRTTLSSDFGTAGLDSQLSSRHSASASLMKAPGRTLPPSTSILTTSGSWNLGTGNSGAGCASTTARNDMIRRSESDQHRRHVRMVRHLNANTLDGGSGSLRETRPKSYDITRFASYTAATAATAAGPACDRPSPPPTLSRFASRGDLGSMIVGGQHTNVHDGSPLAYGELVGLLRSNAPRATALLQAMHMLPDGNQGGNSGPPASGSFQDLPTPTSPNTGVSAMSAPLRCAPTVGPPPLTRGSTEDSSFSRAAQEKASAQGVAPTHFAIPQSQHQQQPLGLSASGRLRLSSSLRKASGPLSLADNPNTMSTVPAPSTPAHTMASRQPGVASTATSFTKVLAPGVLGAGKQLGEPEMQEGAASEGAAGGGGLATQTSGLPFIADVTLMPYVHPVTHE